MQTFYLMGRKINDRNWVDYNRYMTCNVLPTKDYKRKCRHCGNEMTFYVHKKKLCCMCNNYIYPDDKEEFRERMKEVIKNEKSK